MPGPSSHGPPTAHRPHSYIPHTHHQPPMFPSDYNPMMESPPNANALEVPQHQILNLSQPQIIPNSIGVRTPAPSAPTHPPPSSNFPPDIATILNEPSDSQFRSAASLRPEQYPGNSEMTGTRPNRAPDLMQVSVATKILQVIDHECNELSVIHKSISPNGVGLLNVARVLGAQCACVHTF